MSLRQILLWPDSRLRQVAQPVTRFDAGLATLAHDMLETMYAAPGRGLAATQIGVMQRLFVMDCTWKEGVFDPIICINPRIVAASADTADYPEGCLSLPGISATVARPASVTLEWHDLDGTRHEQRLQGFAATCAQHELDHLDGRLCIDLLSAADRAALDPALQQLEQP